MNKMSMKTKGPKRPKRQRLTMLKNIFMLFYYHNTCSRIDNAECLFVDDDTKWMPMDDKMLHFHLYQFVKRVMLLFFLISIWQNENPFQFHLFFVYFIWKACLILYTVVCWQRKPSKTEGMEMTWSKREKTPKRNETMLQKRKTKMFWHRTSDSSLRCTIII